MNKLRDPEANARPGRLLKHYAKAKKTWLRRRRLRTGARLLPFVGDFAIFASGFDEIIRRKYEAFALVHNLGLNINPPYQGLPHNHLGG